ncbi:MAG TPA: choice-of-anchor Q domain-containing protein, partial [Isosphaeraceae bacterium]|nr:choice-of-anchor Q domain-containing protein [Isosphaeraceae bacterium]
MIRRRQRRLEMGSQASRGGAVARRRRKQWALEWLEDRVLLAGTVYTVNLTTDTGTGSGGAGDLLYCITQANANPNSAGSLIEFDPTVFNAGTPKSIKLANALELKETAGPEMIDGPGAAVVTVSGANAVQVFNVQGDTTATLSGLTIFQGKTNQAGGGIYNDGILTVTNCTIANCTSGSEGGGIASGGTLTVTTSTIDQVNTAPFGGGIYSDGTLTVNGSTIDNNTATQGSGGGIENDSGGAMTVTGTTIESNTATVGAGGGISNHGSTSTLSVTDCTISSNMAAKSGGGLDSTGLLTITGSMISSNTSSGTVGGGIDNNGGTASIASSTVSGNSSMSTGGGVFSTAGSLTITASTISGNSVTGSFVSGGGIDEDSGTLFVVNSTIAGNSAGYVGAGIYENSGILTVVSSTIAYNTEPSSGDGFGGGMDIFQGTAALNNTIIALNTDGTGPGAGPDNLYINGSGTVSSASANNLIGAGGGNSGLTNGSHGNQVGVASPGLATLASNGGQTQTIALDANSPAIDAGSNALALDSNGNPLTTDQRGTGFPRIVNGIVDIGAFERSTAAAAPTGYIVNLTSDTGAGSGTEGDLLYVTRLANADTNQLGSVITFDPSVFATPQTITLVSTLELNEAAGPEMIDGPGMNLVTVSGNSAVEVFDVHANVTTTLSGLTISHGAAASGGGIDNTGTLTLSSSTLSGNSAFMGGGIENAAGTAAVNNSTVASNTATIFGGGIENFA